MARPLCFQWVEPSTPDGAEFLKILQSADFIGHRIMLVVFIADEQWKELVEWIATVVGD